VTSPRVVVSFETGDLWHLFDDGRATEVPSEDDLLNLAALNALEPRFSVEIPADQGNVFAIVELLDCRDCEGSGVETGPAWIGGDRASDAHPGPVFIRCAEHDHGPSWREVRDLRAVHVEEEHKHDCCSCRGTGRSYRYSDAILTRRELAVQRRAA